MKSEVMLKTEKKKDNKQKIVLWKLQNKKT